MSIIWRSLVINLVESLSRPRLWDYLVQRKTSTDKIMASSHNKFESVQTFGLSGSAKSLHWLRSRMIKLWHRLMTSFSQCRHCDHLVQRKVCTDWAGRIIKLWHHLMTNLSRCRLWDYLVQRKVCTDWAGRMIKLWQRLMTSLSRCKLWWKYLVQRKACTEQVVW